MTRGFRVKSLDSKDIENRKSEFTCDSEAKTTKISPLTHAGL